MSTDRIIESAREVAKLWGEVSSPQREVMRGYVAPKVASALDELVRRCSAPEIHRTSVRTITSRGRAENGWQPEREYVWSCSCRPGVESGDMGGSPWAKQAADKHRADPTLFPGWIS